MSRVLATYRTTSPTAPSVDLDRLTPRELDVLRVIGRGATNQEPADQLYVREATIKTHLSAVLTKLALRDRAAGIVYAHDNGLV